MFKKIFKIISYPDDSIGTNQVVNDHNNHGDHDHIHGIPVRVPVNFHHPFPEIQVKPDPNAKTEGGQGQEKGQDVMDHHGPFEGCDSPLQDVIIVL